MSKRTPKRLCDWCGHPVARGREHAGRCARKIKQTGKRFIRNA